MIKIFYCNSSDTAIPSEISEYRLGKILSAKKNRQEQINTAKALKAGFASFGINERDIIYGFGESGKPFAKNFPHIHFSISHDGIFTIIAFYDKEIGIDCENINKNIPKEIIQRYFSHTEQSCFQVKALTLWVSKEAYVKYTGKGFAVGRQELEIPYFDNDISASGIWLKRFPIENYECVVCTDAPSEIIVQKI